MKAFSHFNLLQLTMMIQSSLAFQSFLTNIFPKAPTSPQVPSQQIQLENQLLEAITSNSKRLDNSQEITSLISQLEESNYSIQEPAISPQIKGRWKLLFTNNASTASPIQRKAVDASKYNIYQDILLKNDGLIVSQVVKFSKDFVLTVDALASTAEYPLEELTVRQGKGTLGLTILGESIVGEEAMEDPTKPNRRIDFVFDEGNFDFKGVKVPYPVPFRLPLLRDAVKGWIDVTYLSDRVRISKGNKGTTFVLVKEDEEEEEGSE